MSIHLYSDRQSDIIKSKKTLANITYGDIQTALLTLSHRAIQHAMNGENSVIVVQNEIEKEKLIYYLEQLGFSNKFLAINLFDTVRDQDFSQLKNTLSDDSEVAGVEDNYDIFKYKKWNESILSSLQLRYNENILDTTWRDLLDRYISIDGSQTTELLHAALENVKFTFEKAEFEEIKLNISNGMQLYQKQFEWLDTSVLFADLQTKNDLFDRMDEVTHQLFTFKELAQHIRDEYIKVYHNTANEYTKSITASFNHLKYKLELQQCKTDHLEEKLEKRGRGNGILSIFNTGKKAEEAEKQSLIDSLVEIQDECIRIKVTKNRLPIDAISDMATVIQSLLSSIEQCLKDIPLYTSDYLKSVNKLNYADHDLEGLEYDLQQLTGQINHSALLTKKYEVNTLSFKKQMEFSIQLLSEIETVMSRIQNNMPYYQWMIFVSELDKKNAAVVNALKLFDTDKWLQIFERWYYYEILSQKALLTIPDITEAYQKAQFHYVKHKEYEVSKKKAEWWQGLQDELKELKGKNTELYQAIQKNRKTRHPLTWKTLIEENTKFLASIFPILIVDSDELLKMEGHSYQHLCYFNFTNVNIEILQLFTTVFSWFDSQTQIEKPDFHLLEESQNFQKTLSDVSISDRLLMVRNISNILVSFDKIPEIFQLKDTTIISFSTPAFHDKLINSLYSSGIKKVTADDSPLKNLIGAMLDLDKKVVIVIEDGLINPRQLSSYLWQFITIKSLTRAGCKIYNTDTSELLASSGYSQIKMINAIVNMNVSQSLEIKNQLSLEFK